MAVYKRGYNRYQGLISGRWSRLLVLPKYSWRRMLQQRLMVSLLVMSMFWPLGCIGLIYLSNHMELLLNLGPEIKKILQIDNSFFLRFMNIQAFFTILLSVIAGQTLIAPDLSNGVLQLYFSRPFSRTEYVFARLLVLLGLLSLITWIPGILLFSLQSGMAGWSWFAQNWNLGLGVFIGSMLWILLVSLVALASWAYIRWRIMAEALILAILIVLPVVTHIINTVLRVKWASLFNLRHIINQIWSWLLGATPESDSTVLGCWVAVVVTIAVLLMVLRSKLRPVEVIS